MAAITTLIPDVRVHIPEIPVFVASRELIRAAREFCEMTRAWRVDISIGVTASVATVDLTSLLPATTELVDIISIKNILGGQPVVPRTQAWLDTNLTQWRTLEDLNANYYVQSGNNVIRFVYTPSTTIANKYYARVAVKPLIATTTTIDDVIVNKYDEVLVHGALARLFVIPRKPWTDPNYATFHKHLFDQSIGPARTEAAEEFQTGIPRRVKYGGL